jgi:hypothetical protein
MRIDANSCSIRDFVDGMLTFSAACATICDHETANT